VKKASIFLGRMSVCTHRLCTRELMILASTRRSTLTSESPNNLQKTNSSSEKYEVTYFRFYNCYKMSKCSLTEKCRVPQILKLLPMRLIFFDLVIRFITNRKYAFFSMHSFLFIFINNSKNNNSRLQYRNSGFYLDKAVEQTSYEYTCIHTGTYNNDKLKHHDANIHNT